MNESVLDLSMFDGVEVGKCVEIGDGHDVVRIEEDEDLTDDVVGEPFWSVYLHYDPEKSESRGVEAICDCWVSEHAIVIAEALRQQLSVMAG